jgi:hypothetical protein
VSLTTFVRQVRDFVVRPVLTELSLPGGISAEKLVMGTAAQESGFEAIAQIGGGPARGLWQMEPATLEDVFRRTEPVLLLRTRRACGLRQIMAPFPGGDLLAGNLFLGAATCRLLYYLRPVMLSENAADEQLAAWWKRWYNTPSGAGTERQFLTNYRRLVAPLYEGA